MSFDPSEGGLRPPGTPRDRSSAARPAESSVLAKRAAEPSAFGHRAADFSGEEIRALAAFLARRLTPDLRPADPTDAPVYGHSPYDQWQRVLLRAQANGRLARVFRDASRTLPDDPALAEAAALVAANLGSDPVRIGAGALALATAALLMVSFGGVVTGAAMAAFSSSRPAVVAVVAEAPPVVEIAVAQPPPPRVEASPSVASLLPGIGDGADASAAPRVEDGPPGEPTGAPVGVPIDNPKLVAAAARAEGPCKVDGWFYAGTDAPAERFVAPHALHVRAEPPSKENGWSSRAPIRCYLGKGDIVRLDGQPLELPGHHFWVHLTPESVSRPLDLVMR